MKMIRLFGFILLIGTYFVGQSFFFPIYDAAQSGQTPIHFDCGLISGFSLFGILLSTGLMLSLFGEQFLNSLPSRTKSVPWRNFIIPLIWIALVFAPPWWLDLRFRLLGYRCNHFQTLRYLDEQTCVK